MHIHCICTCILVKAYSLATNENRFFINYSYHSFSPRYNFCMWICIHVLVFLLYTVGTLIFAAIFYMVSVAAVFMLFWNYTSWEGCLHNKIFIGVNTFLCIVLSGVTIVPAVTKCKPLCLLNWSIKSPIWWSMFPTCYKYLRFLEL